MDPLNVAALRQVAPAQSVGWCTSLGTPVVSTRSVHAHSTFASVALASSAAFVPPPPSNRIWVVSFITCRMRHQPSTASTDSPPRDRVCDTATRSPVGTGLEKHRRRYDCVGVGGSGLHGRDVHATVRMIRGRVRVVDRVGIMRSGKPMPTLTTARSTSDSSAAASSSLCRRRSGYLMPDGVYDSVGSYSHARRVRS